MTIRSEDAALHGRHGRLCSGIAVLLAGVVVAAMLFARPALAADITLKVHHFLPADAAVPSEFIGPWARKVEAASNGRIAFDIHPDMDLGGHPPALLDQLADGTADIVYAVPSYSPGRFPRTEALEMPFLPASAEATSRAAWDFFQAHLGDEYADYKIIAVNVHGPGRIHVKGKGVSSLEDLEGLKLRGPTGMVNALMVKLGAIAVGMPVSDVTAALKKGLVEGTLAPWEIIGTLGIIDAVDAHTEFSGERGLYTVPLVFAMRRERFEALPKDLQAVIEANSGADVSAEIGRIMDEADARAKSRAQDRGDTFITLNAAETNRWKAAAASVVTAWEKDMAARGIDGAALTKAARDLVAKYAGTHSD